jgi:hypothetical protein
VLSSEAQSGGNVHNTLTLSLGEVAAAEALSLAEQSDRFPDASCEIQIYDTEGRRDLRQKLTEYLTRGTQQQVQVTGISGEGKSHVLLRFAHEQRRAGHLVVYIPTAEQLVRSHVKPLCYAWRKALCAFDPDMFSPSMFAFGKRLTAGADTPEIVAQINKLWSEFAAGGNRLNFVSRAEDIVAQLNELAEGCEKRHCMIVDQDNRLWRSKDAIGPALSSDEPTSLSLAVMRTVSPHMMVVCASANNEGWGRRQWHQLTLNPEPVPENMMDLVLGFEAPLGEVRDYMKEITGSVPLELRLLGEWMRKHTKKVTMESLDQYKEKRKIQVSRAFLNFLPEVDKQTDVMSSVSRFLAALNGNQVAADVNEPHDKRYMYFDGEDDPKFLSPVAADAIADVYQQWLLKQPCVENSKTHGDWYEAQVDRVLRKGTDILRFHGNKQRAVEVCSFEGPRDFGNVSL